MVTIPIRLGLDAREYLALLLLLFIVRGIQIQCLYPPLEGPDEYQHIAYLVYLDEQHRPPVYGQAVVPPSLYPNLVDNPHSEHDWQQTRRIGALRYEQFYDTPPSQIGSSAISLYQAQHPPLYYMLMSPVFIWLQKFFGFRVAVYVLRLLNILLAGIAMVWLLAPLQSLFKDVCLFRPVALAISLSPMFMIYVSRVANDALALAFVGAVVWLLMRWPTGRFPRASAALVGGLLGLGTLTKLTTVSLLPASLAYLLFLALCGEVKRFTVVLGVVMIVSTYLVFTLPFLVKNIEHYGMPFVTQEAIINGQNGKSFVDSFQAIRTDHIKSFFVGRLVQENLWTSGWSFLMPNRLFVNVYSWILVITFGGLLAWVYRIWVKQIPISAVPFNAVVMSVLIVIFTALAAYIHALSAILAWGVIVTPSYYVMVGYPAFLICAFAAARGYGRNAVLGLAMGLTLVFLATEYHSLLWVSATHWAQSNNWAVILSRLATIHPAFLSPWFFFPLATFVILLVAFLVWHNWLVYSQRAAISPITPLPLVGDGL